MLGQNKIRFFFVVFASVLAIVCLMASCNELIDDCINTQDTDNFVTDLAFSGMTERESIHEYMEESTFAPINDSEKEHEFTLIIDETVYPANFNSISFIVQSNKPGVALKLSPQYYVYRVEGNDEILVGFSGTETLIEAVPEDENDYTYIRMSFTQQSLLMNDHFTEGTYRIYHMDDSEVYVEFKLREE